MPAKRIVVPAQKIAEGRFLYEQTPAPMDEIAALMGISRDTLRHRLKEWGWERRRDNPPARGFQRFGNPAAATDAPNEPARGYPREYEERLALVTRLQGIVEQQIEAMETHMPKPATSDEADRNGRALASLMRTLRELKRLEAPPAQSESADDDDMPEDLDELRRELSRKLEALVAGREGAVRSDS